MVAPQNLKQSAVVLSQAIGVVGQEHNLPAEEILRKYKDNKKVIVLGGIFTSDPQALTDGQVGYLPLTEEGLLKVDIGSSVSLTTSENLAQVNGSAVNVGTGASGSGTQRVAVASDSSIIVLGAVAHDAVDSGNPIKFGGYAVDPTSLPTSVSVGDRANVLTSLKGELLAYLSGLIAGEDQANNLLVTQRKLLANSTYSPSIFKNYGANATLNVKSSTGNVFAISCFNANASARYIQIHNTATVPTGGDVPALWFLVPSNQQIVIGSDFFLDSGVNFSTGIAFAFSTTANTYTAGTAADQSTQIVYI